jgi:predicted nucleic acid-binding Zn ribbon protein
LNTASDANEVQAMLRAIDWCLNYPYLIQQAEEKANTGSLYGLMWWLRRRTCKVCRRRIPPDREKTCSAAHGRLWRQRAADQRKRERGASLYVDFLRRIERGAFIDTIAERLELTVEEARARAEVEARRGKMLVWRGADGEIQAVGKPRAPGDKRPVKEVPGPPLAGLPRAPSP